MFHIFWIISRLRMIDWYSD